jgi:2-haloacid dehalogenase
MEDRMPIKAIVFDAYGTLYDVASIGAAIEAVFPGRAEIVTAIWRMKQLEYSWLRTMMGRWQDFRSVTRDSLRYALDTLGLAADTPTLERLVAAQDHLSPYPEAEQALAALSSYRLAILSNGSQSMLDALVGNSGFGRYLEAVISVDPAQAFKPDPRAYALVEQRLGVAPADVAFVTGNGFDTAGASSFGFKVVRVERVAPAVIRRDLATGAPVGPGGFFRAMRMRTEALDHEPTAVVGSLEALPPAIRALGR